MSGPLPSEGMSPVRFPSDDDVERMAEAVHERYLRDAATSTPDHPAAVEWSRLDDGRRAQNRDQVRDLVVRLGEEGFAVVPAEDAPSGRRLDELPDDLVERMARTEHDRWAGRKRAQGYRYGPEVSDDPDDRRHPDLVPWSDLAEEVRDKDRLPVRDLPRVLGVAGWVVLGAPRRTQDD